MANRFSYLLAGLGAGAAVMLLYAPKSGKETRRQISKKAGRAKRFVTRTSADVMDSAAEMYDRGRATLNRAGDAVESAVSVGQKALSRL